MELSLQQRRKALSTKIPDIQQTLSVVKYLQLRRKKALGEEVPEEKDDEDEDDLDDLDDDEEDEGKEDGPMKTLFELNDTLYAEAEVEETGEVGLWLGVSRSDTTLRMCDTGGPTHNRPTRCCCTRCKKR
jgi:hypothetical protein